MTKIMPKHISYTITTPPEQQEDWIGRRVITKYDIKGPWGIIEKGTLMVIVQSNYINVFKTVPNKNLDFPIELTIKADKNKLLSQYIDFVK